MTNKQLKNQPTNHKTAKTYRSKIVVTPIRQYVTTFSNSILHNYDEIRSNYDKASEGTKLARSLQRTRQQLKWLIECNTTPYTKFVSLTITENDDNRERMVARLNYFFKKLRKKLGKKTPYTYILEQQERGAYHAHVCLYLDDYIPQRWLQDLWGYGIVDIRKLKDAKDTARYVMKYVTEDIIGNDLNKKAFVSSPGLQRPTVQYSAEPIHIDNADYTKQYIREITTEQGIHTSHVVLYEKDLSSP
jgi:hypothetical protein